MKIMKTGFLAACGCVLAVASVAGSLSRENRLFSETANVAATTKYTTNGNLRTKYVTDDSPYQIHCTYGNQEILYALTNYSDKKREVSTTVSVSMQGSTDYAVPSSYISFGTQVDFAQSFTVKMDLEPWTYYHEYYKEETQDHRIRTTITIEQKQDGKWVTISSSPTYATSHFYKKGILLTGGKTYNFVH